MSTDIRPGESLPMNAENQSILLESLRARLGPWWRGGIVSYEQAKQRRDPDPPCSVIELRFGEFIIIIDKPTRAVVVMSDRHDRSSLGFMGTGWHEATIDQVSTMLCDLSRSIEEDSAERLEEFTDTVSSMLGAVSGLQPSGSLYSDPLDPRRP